MTNVLIFMVVIMIAGGGLLAIGDGITNQYRRRGSLQYLRVKEAQALPAETGRLEANRPGGILGGVQELCPCLAGFDLPAHTTTR